MAILTYKEFMRVAQIQADILYERGCTIPKELIVSPRLKADLKIGDTITLNYTGEIPVVEDDATVTCMFRGGTKVPMKPLRDNTGQLIKAEHKSYEAGGTVQAKELPKPKGEWYSPEVSPEPVIAEVAPELVAPKKPTNALPPSKRKKAVR